MSKGEITGDIGQGREEAEGRKAWGGRREGKKKEEERGEDGEMIQGRRTNGKEKRKQETEKGEEREKAGVSTALRGSGRHSSLSLATLAGCCQIQGKCDPQATRGGVRSWGVCPLPCGMELGMWP